MKSSRTISLHPSACWGKAAARLGRSGRNDFLFLAALAETEVAGDERLAERLAALSRARRQETIADGK